MKILFLLHKTDKGGAEVQLYNLLKHIDRKRFRPTLGLLYGHGEMKEEYESLGVRTVHFRKGFSLDPTVYCRIMAYIKKEGIDVVHAFMGNHHAYIPSIFGSAIAVGSIRSTHYDDMGWLFRLKEFTLMRMLKPFGKIHLVANSYSGKKLYQDKHVSRSISAIPNGIDVDKYSNGAKGKIVDEFGLKGSTTLSIVGRLIRSKNHSFLLEVFRKLSIEHKVKLLVVGSGPEKRRLYQCIRQKGIEGAYMLGDRSDVPDILAATDIFVFPSNTEGWPNSVGEAMAAGCAVVATPVGDMRRIIDNRKDGVIATKEGFLKEVERLIAQPSLRKRMGRAAKKKIKEKFSVERMVKSYERFYGGLI